MSDAPEPTASDRPAGRPIDESDSDESDSDASGPAPDGLDRTPYSHLESALPADRTDRHASSAHWEAVGRRTLATHLDRLLDDLTREIRETTVACRHGSALTSDHVSRLRDAIEVLECTLEEVVVPLADDAEPWERTPGRLPVGRLREAADPDRSEVRALHELPGE